MRNIQILRSEDEVLKCLSPTCFILLDLYWLGSSQYVSVCDFIWIPSCVRHIFMLFIFKVETYPEVMLGPSSPCLPWTLNEKYKILAPYLFRMTSSASQATHQKPRWVRVSDGTKCVVLAWDRSPRTDLLVKPSVWMGGLCHLIHWFQIYAPCTRVSIVSYNGVWKRSWVLVLTHL